MQIAKIDVFQVSLPYSGGVYRLSGEREYRSFDSTIVRITSDTGLEGWGESTPFGSNYIATHARGVRAGIELLAPSILGLDPRRTERINDVMDRALAGHQSAKSPLDVACWDLFGKSTGMPVYDLLGGSTQTRLPTISSLFAGDPEDMRTRVAEHRALGFRGHSIKVGALDDEGGPSLDAARVTACLADRQAGEFFLVDANGGMTPEAALRFLNLLPPNTDIVFEQPCATWREVASVRSRCSVPIMLDELADSESSVLLSVANDIADGIGLKISKAGGLTKSRRTRDICRAGGLTMSVQDSWGSQIAFAAIVHLAHTVPERLLRCILDPRTTTSVVTAAFDAPVVNGGVVAPAEPGLGVHPDLAVLGEPVASYE